MKRSKVISVTLDQPLIDEFDKWLDSRNNDAPHYDDQLNRSAAIRLAIRDLMAADK